MLFAQKPRFTSIFGKNISDTIFTSINPINVHILESESQRMHNFDQLN